MISDQKLIDLLEKLLEKARADEVYWKQEYFDDPDADDVSCFSVRFNESKLYIQYSCPDMGRDEIDVIIENNKGFLVKRFSVEQDEYDSRWRLFRDLYQEADRAVLGTDQVLSDIEEELNKEGDIGGR